MIAVDKFYSGRSDAPAQKADAEMRKMKDPVIRRKIRKSKSKMLKNRSEDEDKTRIIGTIQVWHRDCWRCTQRTRYRLDNLGKITHTYKYFVILNCQRLLCDAAKDFLRQANHFSCIEYKQQGGGVGQATEAVEWACFDPYQNMEVMHMLQLWWHKLRPSPMFSSGAEDLQLLIAIWRDAAKFNNFVHFDCDRFTDYLGAFLRLSASMGRHQALHAFIGCLLPVLPSNGHQLTHIQRLWYRVPLNLHHSPASYSKTSAVWTETATSEAQEAAMFDSLACGGVGMATPHQFACHSTAKVKFGQLRRCWASVRKVIDLTNMRIAYYSPPS